MLSRQWFGKFRFELFSNVGKVDIPPAVSHPTVHGLDFSPLLCKATSKYYQDRCVRCHLHMSGGYILALLFLEYDTIYFIFIIISLIV